MDMSWKESKSAKPASHCTAWGLPLSEIAKKLGFLDLRLERFECLTGVLD